MKITLPRRASGLRGLPLGALLLLSCLAAWPARAAELSVSITNAPIEEAQAKKIVSFALPADFDRIFPAKQYGVRVLVDEHQGRDGGVVFYMLLGLAHRLPDGRFLQEHTYLSSMEFVRPTAAAGDRRAILEGALAQSARLFAQSMMENAARLK